MATSFREIREGLSPERQERIQNRTHELLAELPLQELSVETPITPILGSAPCPADTEGEKSGND